MISRRWLINYVLIVLICLFTWIGSRYDLQTGEKKSTAVSTLDAVSIDRFAIQTADESLELLRGESGWLIESPIRWPADQVNVERMLDITNAETDSKIAASESTVRRKSACSLQKLGFSRSKYWAAPS